MIRTLVLKSSILGSDSVSNRLVDRLVTEIESRGTKLDISSRDLSLAPVPALDAERLTALTTAPERRNARQRELVEVADALIAELQAAELLVIGAPMYNFSIPAGLKAWIDQVARAGVTFRYTNKGAEGLLKNRQAVVISSMGGEHQPGETDHLRPYLKTVLNFLGLDRVSFVAATGLNLGVESRNRALEQAGARIEVLADQLSGTLTVPHSSKEAA
ncbi:MAG: NAD(P)H-dependent oxidoreductase [Gammaproteobacteria bacterium]|nr:NAD(P)H-dependent oxidoreductase [Pseudomonadales bacterium]MCP5348215.1 NAD(P)H-dependent oxidoreductase [Pseudomonadales bacterium]